MEYDNDVIVAGEQVQEMLSGNGWKNHVSPLLDKMIRDVVGGKDESGRWDNGALAEKNLSDFDKNQLIAYKTALIDLHGLIYRFIDDMEDARKRIREHEQESKYTSEYQPEE